MDPIEQVRAFAEATDLEGKWSSARQMMSSKAIPCYEDCDATAARKIAEPETAFRPCCGQEVETTMIEKQSFEPPSR